MSTEQRPTNYSLSGLTRLQTSDEFGSLDNAAGGRLRTLTDLFHEDIVAWVRGDRFGVIQLGWTLLQHMITTGRVIQQTSGFISVGTESQSRQEGPEWVVSCSTTRAWERPYFYETSSGIRFVLINGAYTHCVTRVDQRDALADFFSATPQWELRHSIVPSDEVARRKAFQNIVLGGEAAGLVSDLVRFQLRRQWWQERDLPYKRSYFLFGPPGNGKTMAIAAMAQYLDLEVETFQFDQAMMTSPDSAFDAWVHRDEDGALLRLLVLEDLDRLYPRGEPQRSKVSMQAILNALDGARRVKNAVIVATANHPEHLEGKAREALTRPGRFDRVFEFRLPTVELGTELLRRSFRREERVSAERLATSALALAGSSYAAHARLLELAAEIADWDGVVADENLSPTVEILDRHVEAATIRLVSELRMRQSEQAPAGVEAGNGHSAAAAEVLISAEATA